MPRWKSNNDGTAYYDPNDSGPDQVQPTPEQRQQQGQPGQPGKSPQFAPTNQSPDLSQQPKNPWSNPGETFNDTYGRFDRDYHALDRDSVLPQMRGAVGQNPGSQGSAWDAPGSTASPFTPPGSGASQPQGQPQAPQPPAAPAWTPTAQNAPPGFEQSKWVDQTHNSPKYTVGRILAGGGSIQDAANAVGAKVVSEDKIQFPDGALYDVFKDTEGAHQVQFTDLTPGGANNIGKPVPGIPGGQFGGFQSQLGPGGAGMSALAPGVPGAPGNPNDLMSILMGRAMQGTNVDANSPVISNQVNAFAADQERARRQYLNEAAERGGPTANLDSERRLSSEHAGQATGAMRGQLIQNELMAKRTEIQNALAQWGGMLTEQQRNSLQMMLSQMDMSLRQQQMNNQNSQFYADLGLRSEDRATYYDLLRSGAI